MSRYRKLYIYDANSWIDRKQANGRFDGEDDVMTYGVERGIKEVKEIFTNLSKNSKMRFNRVVFQTHGNSGMIAFGDEDVYASTLKTEFQGFDVLFPSFTKIYFDGCNVAEGEKGSTFLINAGSMFLERGGGYVIGWKNLGFGMPGVLPGIGGHTIHLGGSKNLKFVRFAPGGRIVEYQTRLM